METGKLRVKKKKRLRQYFITVLLQEQVKNSADRAKWISKDAANYYQKTETQEQNIFQMRRSATILEKNHLQT